MASKIIAFSPTPLPSNHHSFPSGNSIRPFSVVFPSARTTLPVVRAHSTGDNTSLDVRVTSNQGTMEPRLPRRRWALDAFPSGKSSTDQKWEEEGLITESLPDGKFRVKLDNGDSILGYLSGKLRQRFIRVMPGDRVKIEFSRYDLTKGRITYRLRNKDRIIETEE